MAKLQQKEPVPVHADDQTSTIKKNVPRRALAVLGIGQIVTGILAIVFGVIVMVFDCYESHIGTGIWCGICFIFAGSMGYATSRMATKGWIITSMVLSIIAAGFGLILLICNIYFTSEERTYFYDNTSCVYDEWGNRNCPPFQDNTKKSMNGVLLALGLIEAMLAAVYASLCCKPLCKTKQQVPIMYHVVTQPGGVPMGAQQTTVYMMPAGMQFVSQPGGQQFQVIPAPVAYPQQFVYSQPQAGTAQLPQQPQIPPLYQSVASGVTPLPTSDPTNTVKVPLA